MVTADEQKILEDFRSRQAQRKAQAVANSSFDQRERLQLAQQAEAKAKAVREQAKRQAEKQNQIAIQQSQASRQRAEQLAQQNKSKADKGFVQTTTGSGKSINVSPDTARRLAERIRQSEQAKAVREQKQRQVQAQQVSRPITTPTSISDFANNFTQPQTQIKKGKQPDLSKVSPFLTKQPSKSVSKGRSNQFGKQVERGSIGQTVRNLPPANIRQLTKEQQKTPQFLDGQVKQFLTEDQKPKSNQFSFLPSLPEANAEEQFPRTQQQTPFNPFQRNFDKNVQGLQSVLPSRDNPFKIEETTTESTKQIVNPKAGEIVSVREVNTTLPDGRIQTETITEIEPEFNTQTTKETDKKSVETRPDVNSNPLLGFLGGVTQEGVNFGNVVDVATGKGGIDPETGLPLEGTFGFTRKEVGSSVVELPFAVGGALLTKERPEGEGFFGLGFDFDVSDKSLGRAQEAFGETDKFIRDEFARDPARALGSTFAAVGIEVALLVGTAGTATVARKGIVKASQFAIKTRQAKQVAKIYEPLIIKGEEKLPRVIQSIGDNKYVVTVGTDALKGVGTTVISPAKAIVTGITKAGKVVTTKVPLLKFGGKVKDFSRVKGAKTIKHKESDIRAIIKSKNLKGNTDFIMKGQNPKSPRQQAIEELNSAIRLKVQGGASQNPITIIDLGTKTRKPSVQITKRFVPKKATIEKEELTQALITNVDDSARFLAKRKQKDFGLRLVKVETEIPKFKPSKLDRLLGRKEPRLKTEPEVDDGLDQIRALSGKTKVRGESTTLSSGDGRLTDLAVRELKLAERIGQKKGSPKDVSELGATKRVATSFIFTLEDVVKNPQVIKKIVSTERTLTGRGVALPKTVKGAEKLERQGKIPKKQQDTSPITFQTRVVFESKTFGTPEIFAKGRNFGKGSTATKGQAKGSTGQAKGSTGQAKPESIFDDFTNKGKGGSQTVVKGEAKAQAKQQTRQNLSAVRQDIELGIKQSAKKGGQTRVRTPFDSVVGATSLGARTGIIAGIGSNLLDNTKSSTRSRTESEFGTVMVTRSGLKNIFDPLEENKLRNVIPTNIKNTVVKDKLKTGTGILPVLDTAQIQVQVPDVFQDTTPITSTITKTSTIPIPFGGAPPTDFIQSQRIAKEKRARKPSQKGNRLFDVADTPFGKVEVGLGFFIEQQGDESIAESLGLPDKKKTKKNQPSVDNMFDPSGLFGG